MRTVFGTSQLAYWIYWKRCHKGNSFEKAIFIIWKRSKIPSLVVFAKKLTKRALETAVILLLIYRHDFFRVHRQLIRTLVHFWKAPYNDFCFKIWGVSQKRSNAHLQSAACIRLKIDKSLLLMLLHLSKQRILSTRKILPKIFQILLTSDMVMFVLVFSLIPQQFMTIKILNLETQSMVQTILMQESMPCHMNMVTPILVPHSGNTLHPLLIGPKYFLDLSKQTLDGARKFQRFLSLSQMAVHRTVVRFQPQPNHFAIRVSEFLQSVLVMQLKQNWKKLHRHHMRITWYSFLEVRLSRNRRFRRVIFSMHQWLRRISFRSSDNCGVSFFRCIHNFGNSIWQFYFSWLLCSRATSWLSRKYCLPWSWSDWWWRPNRRSWPGHIGRI